MGRKELTSTDVKTLVLDSVTLIHDAQRELRLSICPNLKATGKRLKQGRFIAQHLHHEKPGAYHMMFGAFDPPDTITLDSNLPFCDWPLDIPDIPNTMAHYTAIHEVIHADDHIGGDKTYLATHEHILRDHMDQLKTGMRIIKENANDDCITSPYDLACLWALQYVDILTHYRSYVVLRHHRFPRLDMVWNRMQNELFPPSLMTTIERARSMRYIFKKMIERAGEYCLIDALKENQNIGERMVIKYTV